MGLQVCGIDHDALGLWPVRRKAGENPVEHAEPAPADEPVVQRLVWAITLRRVLPLQAVANDIDDAADDAAVIDPRHAMRQRKMR